MYNAPQKISGTGKKTVKSLIFVNVLAKAFFAVDKDCFVPLDSECEKMINIYQIQGVTNEPTGNSEKSEP